MKLTATQLMIIAGVMAALVTIAVVVLLIAPQFQAITELDGRKLAVEQEMTQTKTRLSQLEQVKRGAAETQAQLIKISNQVPDSPELPTLIIEMQNAADSAGLDFQSIKPAIPAPPSPLGYSAIGVNMKLQGRWADILDFLRRTQRMTRAVRQVSVEVVRCISIAVCVHQARSPVPPVRLAAFQQRCAATRQVAEYAASRVRKACAAIACVTMNIACTRPVFAGLM